MSTTSTIIEKKYSLNDPSLWSLLISNLVTIYLAVTQSWNISTLLWIYWFQNIIIGAFNALRILQLQEFSTEGVLVNKKPVHPSNATKWSGAIFFVVHYGFFHFVYMIFLLTGFVTLWSNNPQSPEIGAILFSAFLFFANHAFSYFYNRPRDTARQNIGNLMFYPYARIIPMHLTIIVGPMFGSVALPFFLILKTLADGIMHVIEHNVLRRNMRED